MKWTSLESHRIKSALHEEAQSGSAWISQPNFTTGQPLVFRTEIGGKRRYVSLICRAIDPSFIKYYEQDMKARYGNPGPLRDGHSYVLLSQHYRERLGIIGVPPTEGRMEPSLKAWQPTGMRGAWHRLCACFDHPDTYVRITMWLVVVSVTVPTLPEVLGWIWSNWPRS